MATWEELNPGLLESINENSLKDILNEAVEFKAWLGKGIYESREKDYTNSFRKMVYDSKEEMNQVLGSFDENAFIKLQQEEFKQFRTRVKKIISKL